MDDKRKMNWWIRLGCFLTGWNKDILQNCSEHSFKKLKRVTSALLVISMIWFFVLYKFGEFYLGFNNEKDPYYIQRIVCGLIGVILVIQIERQVVLNISKDKWLTIIRGATAMLMALIGSIIFDQIIFKDDIEIKKHSYIQEEVNKSLPAEQKDIEKQIASLKVEYDKVEQEYKKLSAETTKKPTIKMYSRVAKTTKTPAIDSLGRNYQKDTIVYKYEYGSIVNPRIKDLQVLRNKQDVFRGQMNNLTDKKINMRKELKKEISDNQGFLQELKIMVKEFLLKSWITRIFWFVLFSFLLMLELLVLFATFGDCDYEEIIRKQKEIYSPNKEDMK